MSEKINLIPTKILAITSFILGLFAVIAGLTSYFRLAILFWLTAMIIGGIALSRIKEQGGKVKLIAIFGLIFGLTVLYLLFIGLFIHFMVSLG